MQSGMAIQRWTIRKKVGMRSGATADLFFKSGTLAEVIHCTRCWSGLLLALLSIGLIACWYIAPRHTLGQLVANRSQLKQGARSRNSRA
eukprot:6484587-Amphidinium_carterae.1